MNQPAKDRLFFEHLSYLALGWLGTFILIPFLLLIAVSLSSEDPQSGSFAASLSAFAHILKAPYWQIIAASLVIVAIATCLCLVAALPCVIHLKRMNPRYARLLYGLLMSPFLINFLVRVYAWFVLLRPEGIISLSLARLGIHIPFISSWPGLLLGLVYGYFPFMMIPLWTVMSRFDPRQWDAAADLGASEKSILWHIVLPHLKPGILAGCTLVAIPMLGEYCIPKMLGAGLIPTIGTLIESQFLSGVRPNWPFGSALAVAVLLLSLLLISLVRHFPATLWQRSKL